MKCLICGKDYIALGVHVKLGHKIDPDDYRDEFGMMKNQPLVDDDLSEYLSKKANERLIADPEWREEMTARMLKYNGKTSGGRGMSKVAREKVGQRNKDKAKKYLESIAGKVASILEEKKTLRDVRTDLGCGERTTMKIVEMGKAKYDLDLALEIRKQRAKAAGNVKKKRD